MTEKENSSKKEIKQEINIGKIKKDVTEESTSSRMDFSAKVPHLTISPGATAEQIIDVLINTPKEQLMPWENCWLPSRGVYYNGKIPDGKVQVRPMGIDVDKIFATARLTQTNQAIDYMFRNCVKLPDASMDSLDLINGDRTFLIFFLRGITHGNIYEFIVTCPDDNCKAEFTYEYDLNKLGSTIKYPKFESEPVKVVLPYLSEVAQRECWVGVRYLRGYDMRTIQTYQKSKERIVGGASNKVPINEAIESNLNLVIESINGIQDKAKISQIVSAMHTKDTQAVRRFLDDSMPGIGTDIKIVCPDCGRDFTLDLPITETFFRPKDPRGVRA
jgi:hypothetical protein